MMKLFFLILSIGALSGCATSTTMYSVSGPVTVQNPGTTYTLKSFQDVGSVTLLDGEVCSGPWVSHTPKEISAAELAPAWDSVYGAGYFAANVLGTNIFTASLTGNRGTTLQIAVLQRGPLSPGVATDSRGNIYKLAY
jgi:hypothetical protein